MAIAYATTTKSLLAAIALLPLGAIASTAAEGSPCLQTLEAQSVRETVGDWEIAFREAGNPANPTVLLLESGSRYPASFSSLSAKLAKDFHVLAPDYDNLTDGSTPGARAQVQTTEIKAAAITQLLSRRGVDSYALFITAGSSDLARELFEHAPEKVTGLVASSGKRHASALDSFWGPLKSYWQQQSDQTAKGFRASLNVQGDRWQFTLGMKNPEGTGEQDYWYAQFLVAWDNEKSVQLGHFLNFGTDADGHLSWQKALGRRQPPVLIVWETEPETAGPLAPKTVDFRLDDAGSYVPVDNMEHVAERMMTFLDRVTSR